ncbi:hypothetical protein HY642_03515, partial [Candidatus Woesearchaeota archaeon]|nr:hypothetical protein [Candidatus Woesearchaeota archaeon]
MDPSNNKALITARIMPYFKITKEPVNPTNERSNGLQNGQVVVKKLINAPTKPTFAGCRDFCLFLTANTWREMRSPPKIENITKKVTLVEVKAILIFFNPNL